MGLQLSKELSSGVTGDYWRIDNALLVNAGSVSVVLNLFKDQAARNDDKEPLETVSYKWDGGDNPCTVAAMNAVDVNPYILCYEKLKTLPEFAGATDQ